jgi:hypothetical protein
VRWSLVVAALLLGACVSAPETFHCTGAASCGAQGLCEPDSYCAFSDSTCSSGYRYDPSAGEGLGGSCFVQPQWTLASPVSLRLSAIWGSGPNDVYAAGDCGTVLHNDGSGWKSPTSIPAGAQYAVGGSSSTDVWVVGYGASHYDGQAWADASPTQNTVLYGVVSRGPNDATAVGSGGAILQWDGSSWNTVSSGVTVNFAAIWSGGGDRWISGDQGTVLRWGGPGTSLSTETTPADLAQLSVFALWGPGSTPLYAVAGSGVLHYSSASSSWSDVPVPCPQASAAVGGTSARDVWVVGAGGYLLHYDGSGWSPTPGLTTQYLTAVWADAWNDVYVTGYNGAILHYH